MSILVWSKDGLTCDYHFIGMVNWPIGHWWWSWTMVMVMIMVLVILLFEPINYCSPAWIHYQQEDWDRGCCWWGEEGQWWSQQDHPFYPSLHYFQQSGLSLKNPNFWDSAQAGVWQRKAEKRVEVESPDWRAYTGAQSRRGIGWKWSHRVPLHGLHCDRAFFKHKE